MLQFHVTYDIVTQESAEHGDAAERGFVLPGGWHEVMPDDCCGDAAHAIKAQCGMTLREAVDLVGLVEDGGHGFYEVDGREDYGTGEHETRALHPPETITAASYARLRRLLKA